MDIITEFLSRLDFSHFAKQTLNLNLRKKVLNKLCFLIFSENIITKEKKIRLLSNKQFILPEWVLIEFPMKFEELGKLARSSWPNLFREKGI